MAEPKAVAEEPRAVALRAVVRPVAAQAAAAANLAVVAAVDRPAAVALQAVHPMQVAAPLAVVRAVIPLPAVPVVVAAAQDLRAAATRAAVAAA